jgi:hypothetical protein
MSGRFVRESAFYVRILSLPCSQEFREAHNAGKAYHGGHSVITDMSQTQTDPVASKPLATVGDVVEMLQKGAASLGVDGSVGVPHGGCPMGSFRYSYNEDFE